MSNEEMIAYIKTIQNKKGITKNDKLILQKIIDELEKPLNLDQKCKVADLILKALGIGLNILSKWI